MFIKLEKLHSFIQEYFYEFLSKKVSISLFEEKILISFEGDEIFFLIEEEIIFGDGMLDIKNKNFLLLAQRLLPILNKNLFEYLSVKVEKSQVKKTTAELGESLQWFTSYSFEGANGIMIKQIVCRLTYNCNQRCKFCNVVSGKNSKYKQLHLIALKSQFLTLIKEENLNKKQIIHVTLSGGEPTMHPDFFLIYDFFSKFSERITIQTNGVMFAQDYFQREILKRKITTPFFYISFHSHVLESYQVITKTKKDYGDAVLGIEFISKNFTNIELNHVFHEENVSVFVEYMTFIYNKFITLNPNITCNISSIIGVSEDIGLPKYSDIFAQIQKAKPFIQINKIHTMGLFELGGSPCDIPFCVFKGDDDLGRPSGIIYESGSDIDISMKKMPQCDGCIYNNRCSGVPEIYIEKYGIEEFSACVEGNP